MQIWEEKLSCVVLGTQQVHDKSYSSHVISEIKIVKPLAGNESDSEPLLAAGSRHTHTHTHTDARAHTHKHKVRIQVEMFVHTWKHPKKVKSVSLELGWWSVKQCYGHLPSNEYVLLTVVFPTNIIFQPKKKNQNTFFQNLQKWCNHRAAH